MIKSQLDSVLTRIVKEISGAPSIILADGQPYKVIPTPFADELEAALASPAASRVDNIPPDGWVTELRGLFGIDDDATWQDILIECAQTKRLALRATKEFIDSQSVAPPAGVSTPQRTCDCEVYQTCEKCRDEEGRRMIRDLEAKAIRESIYYISDKIAHYNHRWWRDPATGADISRNVGEMLMLVTSELAEALEGDRKNLNDDKLPHYKMFDVEIVDALIRLFDIAGHLCPKIGDIMIEKLQFNSIRKDHTNEGRLAEGGKKY